MSTGFPTNVDGNVENISIFYRKKPKNPDDYAESYVYIYIYTHTHTHTHTHKKAHFSSILMRKSAKN